MPLTDTDINPGQHNKGNHDRLGDEWYHCAFENVEKEMHIDELNLRLINAKEARNLP